jgi:uncharacterized SAM-binding protein YcdF (DUF218 family)
MLHYASKLLSFVWEPLVWLALIWCVGTLLLYVRSDRAKRWGRRACAFALCLFALFAWQGLPATLIAEDEAQYVQPSDLSTFQGLIVLGGAIESPRIQATAMPPLACSGDRVTEAVPLMRRYPHFKLLFTGGDARLTDSPESEADVARSYFDQMGVDRTRVIYESRSRNTYENAQFSRDLPGVNPNERWLLVTSAWHMSRAIATFKKAGWNVEAYPVDYYSPSGVSIGTFSLEGGVGAWRMLLRERIGYAVYRALGRA